MWQHPPGNAAADNIEDPVEDLAKLTLRGRPPGFALGSSGAMTFHCSSVTSVG